MTTINLFQLLIIKYDFVLPKKRNNRKIVPIKVENEAKIDENDEN